MKSGGEVKEEKKVQIVNRLPTSGGVQASELKNLAENISIELEEGREAVRREIMVIQNQNLAECLKKVDSYFKVKSDTEI
jgi:hypothetical protein